MLQLKEYQQQALDYLSRYFTECARTVDADTTFYAITRQVYGTGIPYESVDCLPGLPYVCLRIPTGGGKTLMACHAVGSALRDLLRADRCVVLWLVPSNAIREQTLKALKDRAHPYRQALEATTGTVRVLDLGEALYVTRADLEADTVIIVSTMQAFRVDDIEGRKVYESSGSLMDHFQGLPDDALAAAEPGPNGTTAYSLANVLRIRRPVVIVDEAHNARTDLSFETLARFNPSCIIEFTATPDTREHPSNVLYSVSAAELNAAAMIKMPIILETQPDWKGLLSDAVAQRAQLEQSARAERTQSGEHIRPIMLIQAQPKRQGRETLSVEVIEQHLKDDLQIPPEQIKRATGTDHGLEGVDLFDPECRVRYVITVQALREGWDCSFAYVLCSVAEMSSPTAVEQILGRIMRLPKATRKAMANLNQAYAFVASHNFAKTAQALADALVLCHGFNRQEARDLIRERTPQESQLPLGLAEPSVVPVSITLPEVPLAPQFPPDLASRTTFDKASAKLTFVGPMTEQEREALKGCFSTAAGRAAVDLLFQRACVLHPTGSVTPSQRGVKFSVPVLAVRRGGLFEVLEETHLATPPLPLSHCDATLSESEFASERVAGTRGKITVTQTGKVHVEFLSNLERQMALLDRESYWSVPGLAHWLDRQIAHPDVTSQESGIFLVRLLQYLVDERKLDIGRLGRDRQRLRDAVAAKIEQHRRQYRSSNYQALVLPDSPTPVIVTPDLCFQYPASEYPYNRLYQGAYRFSRHYYPQIGDLDDHGEEFECACYLDAHPRVQHWVRNLERRQSHSFWLQTATDKFYPDFVCLLTDGRYLVVEHKGEHLWSNDDSKEKRNIGGLWEARSDGACLFVMMRGQAFAAIKEKIG